MVFSDFTIIKYLQLCHSIQNQSYSFLTVSKYLELKSENLLPDKFVILRHDVDRWIRNSLVMAKKEYDTGITSTYYFRYPATFDPETIMVIHGLGHETGYHYEVLSKNHGNEETAIKSFIKELSAFRNITQVKTICMHGNPLSSFDNRDLWKKYNFTEYGIIGEAFLSIRDLPYFTDTGRTWSGKRAIYDSMPGLHSLQDVDNTDDLIKWIITTSPKGLYLTVHPERWAPDSLGYLKSRSMDLVVNSMKGLLFKIQG